LMLWRQPIRTWRLGEWIFSVSLLVSVIAAILRALTALVESETAMAMSILSYQGAQANYLTINLLATVFIAFGLIVMTQDNLRRDLERLASYDALTGVLTRRVILDLLEKSMAKVSRTGQPLAVMMIDLDHFKRINDNFGHRVGDRVLTKVIDAVESVLRKDTYIGRYGGEEFLIVMPDTSLEQLLEVSERIRQMAAKTVVHFQQSTIQCTISIGALIIDATNIDSLTDPVTHADKALYQAKQQGRNQVVVAGASPESSLLKTEST
ncbi:MAG: GGDEF domain-containing protein, partial [Pseudomonadota bacterium]|nr:GGDEF domain-containing protein [Pseudomonadota bacterium]